MDNPKQLAQTGISYLEEAILDVLFEAKHSKESDFVRGRDIRERLGTHSKWKKRNLACAFRALQITRRGTGSAKRKKRPF